MIDTEAEYRARLDAALSVVKGNHQQLQQRLRLWTVPLFFFKDERGKLVRDGNGSGVLFRLGGRSFILTAGHCVTAARERIISVPVARGAHRFDISPRAMNWGGLKEVLDFGYFELAPSDVAIIESQHRAFIGPGRIALLDPTGTDQSSDVFSLCGYPAIEVVDNADGTRTPTPIDVVTLPASPPITPASTIAAPSTPIPHLDFWIPGEMRGLRGETETGASVPELRGASGGGWWLLNALHDSEGWSLDRLRLVGTHMGSSVDEPMPGGRTHRFARTALISSHMALLLHDFPELQKPLQAALNEQREAAASGSGGA